MYLWYQSVWEWTCREITSTSSVTQISTCSQYAQVAFQYSFIIPRLAVSPPADNDIWKCFEVQVQKPDGIYLNFGKYVCLGRGCEQKKCG